LSGLLTIVSLFINNRFSDTVIIIVLLLGLILCYTWYVHIESYKQLNSGRFKVIHEIECKLPFCCFTEEWELLKHGNGENYTRLTKVEQMVPIFFGMLFLCFLIAFYLC
jgi:hypothetical protein